MKRLFSLLLCLCLFIPLLSACDSRSALPENNEISEEDLQKFKDKYDPDEKAEKEKTQIILLGDSTSTWYQQDPSKPEYLIERNLMGWSRYFTYYFDDSISMKYLSFGGSSTLIFSESEQYNWYKSALSEGDIVLIQYLHNEVLNGKQHTDPTIPLEDADASCKDKNGNVSYQAALYSFCIRPALEAGATPILLSPTLHLDTKTGTGKLPDTYLDYIAAMKDLAEDLDIAFIDLSEDLFALYDEVGKSKDLKTTALHAYLDETASSIDKLHLSHIGAYKVAGVIAKKLAESVPAFDEWLLETPKEFDKELFVKIP